VCCWPWEGTALTASEPAGLLEGIFALWSSLSLALALSRSFSLVRFVFHPALVEEQRLTVTGLSFWVMQVTQ